MINIFPKTNIEINTIKDNNILKLGKCFKFNFQTGQHFIVDGKLVECDFIENIQHFIQVVLRTKINTFKVYIEDEEEDFGLSIYNHIGNKEYNKGFIFSEVKREIIEQLLNHPFIIDINNFDFNFNRNEMIISFNCYLKNNEILTFKEVMFF